MMFSMVEESMCPRPINSIQGIGTKASDTGKVSNHGSMVQDMSAGMIKTNEVVRALWLVAYALVDASASRE